MASAAGRPHFEQTNESEIAIFVHAGDISRELADRHRRRRIEFLWRHETKGKKRISFRVDRSSCVSSLTVICIEIIQMTGIAHIPIDRSVGLHQITARVMFLSDQIRIAHEHSSTVRQKSPDEEKRRGVESVRHFSFTFDRR